MTLPFRITGKNTIITGLEWGLLVTKRTFDYFHIAFHDKEGNDIPWDKQKTIGTIITMRSNYSNESMNERPTGITVMPKY